MSETDMFAPNSIPRNEVVLGVYGSEDWVIADLQRERHLSGKKTLEIQETWLTPPGFKLRDWVLSRGFESYTFYSKSKVMIPSVYGILVLAANKGKIEVTVTGDPHWIVDWERKFDAEFKRAENLIEWVYNARGDTASVPLNYRPAIPQAYPWIDAPLAEYFDSYLKSDANVLILIGPPGTGKTTFIKNLIHHAGGDAKVAYDQKVLEADDFFAGFIEDECRFLIMEDADSFLDSREDGNTMMHKFLNVSDGLISAADKKLVFSTNLPSVRDIDSALLREGRCFDILEFRALSRDESRKVLEAVGSDRELPDGKEFTLAELFQSQPSGSKRANRPVGFSV